MKRIVYLVLGIFSFLLGVAGVLLPVMPGVIFFVLAAFFFSQSSQTLHQALYKTPYIGKAIKEWDTNKTMNRQVKFMIVSLAFGMAAYPYFLVENKAYAVVMTNFFLIALFTVFAIAPEREEA